MLIAHPCDGALCFSLFICRSNVLHLQHPFEMCNIHVGSCYYWIIIHNPLTIVNKSLDDFARLFPWSVCRFCHVEFGGTLVPKRDIPRIGIVYVKSLCAAARHRRHSMPFFARHEKIPLNASLEYLFNQVSISLAHGTAFGESAPHLTTFRYAWSVYERQLTYDPSNATYFK